MNRRTFITTAAGSLAVPLLVVAQQPATIWRIGVLLTGASPLPGAPASDPLERGLREYGYEPGKNLTYVVRAAEGRSVGLKIQRVVIASASDMEPAFSAIARTRAGTMLVHSFPLTMSNVPRIAEFAIKNHLPTISTNSGAARRGLLMSYGPNFIELERRVAGYLDRIFKGAKAGDLPVEQPTKFELVINLKSARALGLTIPQSLLLRADEVIQ